MKTIVICSGGLDSVSRAHRVAAEHDLLGLLSFDYGQRHRKELDFAAACATRLNVRHQIIDIRAIGQSLSGSALTDDVAVQAALNISLDTLNTEWRATLPAAERTPEPVAAPEHLGHEADVGLGPDAGQPAQVTGECGEVGIRFRDGEVGHGALLWTGDPDGRCVGR